ncbi:MAG TPA: PIN domain nuclease [Deltaproteobacteria bacterium]|nr:MAG: hypothetical protein A2048_07665 [Deltaproteobacteria bacterium GWA2_45_12]HBF12939.1 PIN domain nuclease [Deltaproteobacteria bacterium]
MPYLFDTDTYIFLSAGNKSIKQKIDEVGDSQISLSSITVAELYFGIFQSKKVQENLKAIQKNIEKLEIFNFNKHTAKIFGRLKAHLKQKGAPIADMDLAIAAIAIHHDCILITHNTKHFEAIPELLVEDWYR